MNKLLAVIILPVLLFCTVSSFAQEAVNKQYNLYLNNQKHLDKTEQDLIKKLNAVKAEKDALEVRIKAVEERALKAEIAKPSGASLQFIQKLLRKKTPLGISDLSKVTDKKVYDLLDKEGKFATINPGGISSTELLLEAFKAGNMKLVSYILKGDVSSGLSIELDIKLFEIVKNADEKTMAQYEQVLSAKDKLNFARLFICRYQRERRVLANDRVYNLIIDALKNTKSVPATDPIIDQNRYNWFVHPYYCSLRANRAHKSSYMVAKVFIISAHEREILKEILLLLDRSNTGGLKEMMTADMVDTEDFYIELVKTARAANIDLSGVSAAIAKEYTPKDREERKALKHLLNALEGKKLDQDRNFRDCVDGVCVSIFGE